MNVFGNYRELEFYKTRTIAVDSFEEGRKRHHVSILMEIDVTKGRSQIRYFKERNAESLSFTGWTVKCIAQALSEHKQVHAMRKGGKKLIVFDDIDVLVPIERVPADAPTKLETYPMPYVIRRAEQKTVGQITAEIRMAQGAPVKPGQVFLDRSIDPRLARLFYSFPSLLRRWLMWRRLRKDPFYTKRMMGTVLVTTIGTLGNIARGGSWLIPVGLHQVEFVLGSISRKPGVVEDRIEIREYLGLTVAFDHDVIDGAPVARFVDRLRELIEGGFGLDNERSPIEARERLTV